MKDPGATPGSCNAAGSERNRSAEKLLQALDQSLELLLEALLPLFDRLDALRYRLAQIARDPASGGTAGTAAGRTAGWATGARALLATTAAALAAELTEDLHRLRMETPRAALALVRQAIGVETDVAHERRIRDPRRLADLCQRQEIAGLLRAPAARRSRSGRVLARTAAAGGRRRRCRRRCRFAPTPLRCGGLGGTARTALARRRLLLGPRRRRVL